MKPSLSSAGKCHPARVQVAAGSTLSRTFPSFKPALAFKPFFLLLFAACFLLNAGCASRPPQGRTALNEQERLRNQLLQLDPSVEQIEARRVAEKAVAHSAFLAEQYRALKPPWLHNLMVNNGWRDRGLCYQWANDLYPELRKLEVWSLKFHLVVAHMDTPKEHNAIVVTALNQPLTNGLVLDAWRGSGKLWFGKAAADKYPWEILPADRVNVKLRPLLNP